MAKQHKKAKIQPVPTLVVGLVAIIGLGVFLQYYTGLFGPRVLGAQTAAVIERKPGGFGTWQESIHQWFGKKVDMIKPYRPIKPTETNKKPVGANNPDDDSDILQMIQSTDDDGGASAWKELEQM